MNQTDELYHQILDRKLEEYGWIKTDTGRGPPLGMGGYAAQEQLEKAKREARWEIARRPHWHEQNPWNDHIVYVPIEELADAAYLLGQPVHTPDGRVIYTKEILLKNWRQHGDKLDAYVLTGRVFYGGIRFGPEPNQYLSPGFYLDKLKELVSRYQPKPKFSDYPELIA